MFSLRKLIIYDFKSYFYHIQLNPKLVERFDPGIFLKLAECIDSPQIDGSSDDSCLGLKVRLVESYTDVHVLVTCTGNGEAS